MLPTRIDVSDPDFASASARNALELPQPWYRDTVAGGAGFNLSDAIRVTFH